MSTTNYDRVQAHTAPDVNARIQRQIEGSVAFYAQQDRDAMIRRIEELDREWDIDRALMALFPILGGITLSAGRRKKRGWMYVLYAQMAFLFVHATYGWCPPVALLRRMGFRTHHEIDSEKRQLERMVNDARNFS